MRLLLAVLLAFVAGVQGFAQQQGLNLGLNLTNQINKVSVTLMRSLPDGGGFLRTDFISKPYEPNSEALETTLSSAVKTLAQRFVAQPGDEDRTFIFSFRGQTSLGETNDMYLTASSNEIIEFRLKNGKVPSDWIVPIKFASYTAFWQPNVVKVTLIPLDKDGNEMLDQITVTVNGVSDETCPLFNDAGNGAIYLPLSISSGSSRYHVVLHYSDDSWTKVDNSTGEAIDFQQAVPTLSMQVGKESTILSVRGSGNVVLECSQDLKTWLQCTEITAPGQYTDTNTLGTMRFYRIRQVGTPQSVK